MTISMKQLKVLKSVINVLDETYDDLEYNITTTNDGSIVLTGSDVFEADVLENYLPKGLNIGIEWDTITIPFQK